MPSPFRLLIADLLENLTRLKQPGQDLAKQSVVAWHRQSQLSKKLEAIPGIGPLTATAIVQTIDTGRHFSSSRQFAS